MKKISHFLSYASLPQEQVPVTVWPGILAAKTSGESSYFLERGTREGGLWAGEHEGKL